MAPKRVSSSGGSSLEASAAKRRPPHPAPEEEESDPEGGWETEEEELVHVELSGTFQDDIGRQPGILTKLVGLDTERPIVQIGGQVRDLHFFTSVVLYETSCSLSQVFEGKYVQSAGTSVFLRPSDRDTEGADQVFDKLPSKQVEYLCKTDKKLVLKRVFLNRREEETSPQQQSDQGKREGAN